MKNQQASKRILIVDDEPEMARTLCEGLTELGFSAVPAFSGQAALELLTTQPFDALVTDLRMDGMDGLTLMLQARALCPECPTLIMTAHGAVDSAVESIRQGAYHYLTKPFGLTELAIFLRRALAERKLHQEAASLRATPRERFGWSTVIGQAASLRTVLTTLERVAGSDLPLLIGGETGTGKGLLARVVHTESCRKNGPLVQVNCAALPEHLLESELFGHEKGAFTGAVRSRKGLFAQASGGTLFLDEIGDLPLPLQGKLLHVLEEGLVRPVGSDVPTQITVRVIAATHHDLRQAVRAGLFRQDLFYRLDVVSVVLPPLRDRREDLPSLLEHFLREQLARHPQSRVQRIGPEAMRCLLAYDWPGNVRELSHVLERALVLGRGPEISIDDLPPVLHQPEKPLLVLVDDEIQPIRTVQKRYAAWAVSRCGGQRQKAADKLGVDVKTLYNWLSDGKD